MRVTLYPFFSQQCKVTRRFRLDSDSGVRLYEHLGRTLRAFGHSVTIVTPPHHQCNTMLRTPLTQHVLPELELDNLDRRLQWLPSAWRWLAQQTDLLLTQHEHLPYVMRCLGYTGKLVMEVGMRPETAYSTQDLFPLNWKACDLIHCNSHQLASELAMYHGVRNTTVWTYAFDDVLAAPQDMPKTIDVLFNARASATDYSNHKLFVREVQQVLAERPGLQVRCTDPTGYLRKSGDCPQEWVYGVPLAREEYVDVMQRARVVVSLTDNGYGGYAYREAMACGAVPVVPNMPEYVELLGHDWPYVCHVGTPGSVAKAIVRALDGGRPPQWADAWNRLMLSSYTNTSLRARRDLEELFHDPSA